MTSTYFLGANSRDGFASLYTDFPPDDGAFLHILKSGPGTGKSGFLRRIAAEAEARGLDVHTVLCSGDPDSLDGVFVPALRQAWVDGTAPHVVEPKIFGADADYLNLGRFFTLPFTDEEKNTLQTLHARYKSSYADAYTHLRHCEESAWIYSPKLETGSAAKRLSRLGHRIGTKPRLTRRFISAISCKGILRMNEPLNEMEVLETSPGELIQVTQLALAQGWSPILCLTPLDPGRAEALLLPEAGLAFTAFPQPSKEAEEGLLAAVKALRQAKSLHDELEAVYKPHMDFAALTAYTEKIIEGLYA